MMLLKSSALLLLAHLLSCQQIIQMQDLSISYDYILNPQKFCQNKIAAIQTDKPVYKVGEVVRVTVYFYDKMTKKPLNKCRDNRYFSFEVLDGLDKNIGYFSRDVDENEKIEDYSSFTKEITIDDKYKGGVYKVKYSQEPEEIAKFFVLAFNNRTSGVVSDWNLETIKPGDQLNGKITLKTFSKDFSAYKTITANYSFTNQKGEILQEKKGVSVTNPTFDVSIKVPENIGGILVF